MLGTQAWPSWQLPEVPDLDFPGIKLGPQPPPLWLFVVTSALSVGAIGLTVWALTKKG